MKLRFLLVAAALTLTAGALASPRDHSYRQAVSLYNHGMYESARDILESLDGHDALSDGYAVLCVLQTRPEGWKERVASYDAAYPESSLQPQIHYLYGLNLFDEGDFEGARREFASFSQDKLYKKQIPEFVFKQAYTYFELGDYDRARDGFVISEKLPFSDLTAPSRYAIGYIDYAERDFAGAQEWLAQAAKDPRFTDNALYYILECRFMQNDYAYVLEHGDEVYSNVPEERKAHLSRIISEAYLVSGDVEKARQYYDQVEVSGTKDYFYAGSLLYALGDWQGAIDNFTMMTSRTDSLGQVASYQLANAYLQTKNKVSALDAFREASELPFDADIREDAMFNYAKLAFDLNHDSSAFDRYLERYSDTKRGDIIYSYVAVASLYNHDYAAAVAAYDNIDELTPDMRANYMKANYLRANQLIQNGSWRDAVPCLRAASFYTGKNDTFNQLTRYWLAESYIQSDRYQDATTILNDLYNLSALDSREEGYAIPYNLAYAYFQQEDYAAAAKWFDKYLSSSHSAFREDALTRRADCDFIRKDYPAAISGYSAVLKEYSSPDNIYPYYQLGLAYGLADDVKSKAETLSRVNAASPSSPLYCEALYELGRSYVSLNDSPRAVAAFKRLHDSAKDQNYVARSLIELGMISRNNSRYDEALDYYKQVVEKLPNSEYGEDALIAIESIYQAKGEPEVYFAYVEGRGVGAGKSDAEKELVYFNSAEQIFLTGNYQKAVVSLQKYLDAYPGGEHIADAEFYLAECYRGLGQKEKAVDAYSLSLAAKGGSFRESALLNYSDLSYSLEHYSEAFRGYQQLNEAALMEANVYASELGMMRSAYRAHSFGDALAAAEVVRADSRSDAGVVREADYVTAKSLLASSRRAEAFTILEKLAKSPSTDEGAEAAYLLIQDIYDQGNFDKVESRVYDFSEKASGQSYWLAKAFIVLGDSFAEKDNIAQARATFESIADGYVPEGPEDDVLDNVRMRLEKLAEM